MRPDAGGTARRQRASWAGDLLCLALGEEVAVLRVKILDARAARAEADLVFRYPLRGLVSAGWLFSGIVAENRSGPALWAATASALDDMGGVYCEACNVSEVVPDDSNAFTGVRQWAIDSAIAERTWEETETLIAGL